MAKSQSETTNHVAEAKQKAVCHVGGCQNPGLNDWPEPEGSEDLKEEDTKRFRFKLVCLLPKTQGIQKYLLLYNIFGDNTRTKKGEQSISDSRTYSGCSFLSWNGVFF